MIPRLILIATLLLSTTGCVAIPLAAQLASGATSAAQLCAMARLPGQASLCDRFPGASSVQAQGKPAPGTTMIR